MIERPSTRCTDGGISGADPKVAASADPLPVIDAPHPAAELEGAVLAAAGLEVVVEQGQVIGELLGLEVARVNVDDEGGTRY